VLDGSGTSKSNSILFTPGINLFESQPVNIIDTISPPNATLPVYGCLKNGNLPTYRNYISQSQNTTRKNLPHFLPSTSPPLPPQYIMNSQDQFNGNEGEPSIINIEDLPPFDTSISSDIEIDASKTTEIKAYNELRKQQAKSEKKNKIKQKQKKTKTRTYKVGKLRNEPTIAVLVSNRNIRNNITTKTQLLKQDSIQDVKTFLIKKGLIKVGSVAPNDVLRKMYESAKLMCGEIQNHNPDNLLYNFVHL
jgi:hypothetical protein